MHLRLRPASPRAASLRLLFVLVAATSLGRADEGTSDLLRLALHSPEEARGDYDRLVEQWLKALPRHRDDFRAELLARRIAEVIPYLRDPGARIADFENALSGSGGDGWWRSTLSAVLADLYRRSGQDERATQLDVASGHLRRWWVIGPFDKRGARDIDAVFPPETAQTLDATYEDGWQTLAWRAVRLGPHETRLRTSALGHPSRGFFYALTELRSEERRSALLVAGASDDLRVWLNGELVLAHDAYREFQTVPRVVEVELAAGANRLLVKTPAPFWIRLADPRGHPLVLSTGDGDALGELPAAQESRDARETPPRDPLSRWRAERSGRPAGSDQPGEPGGAEPQATAEPGGRRHDVDDDLGFALLALEYARPDLAVEAAESALALAPEDPAVLYHAGRVFQRSTYLPSTLAKNRAESAFTAAVEKDPDFLPAYERLADYLADDKKYADAAARMHEALERSPGFLPGLFRLKRIYAEADWDSEEIATVRDIEKYAPRSTLPPLFWGAYYSARSNPTAAREAYARALDLDRSRYELLKTLADIAIERGDMTDAEARLRAWVKRVPYSRTVRTALIEFLVSTKRDAEALEIARALREEFPQDPRWPRRIATLLEGMGREAEALEEYRAALALEPGQLDLKRFLARRTSRGDRFWEAYDEKLEDWVEQVPTSGPLIEKAASIAILDIGVRRVERDGSSSSYVHQAFKLLSDESKKTLAEVDTPGEVVTLRTITADGEVLEPVPATGKRRYAMPGLSAGAVIEMAYRSDDEERAGRPFREERFYFQDPSFAQSFLLSRYVVILEPGVEMELDETRLAVPQGDPEKGDGPSLATVEKTERELEDGTRIVIYETRHAARLDAEPLQPTSTEYLPNVRLVEKDDWTAVSTALRRIQRGRTRPTSELRRVAEEVTSGLDSPLEKARALYAHVAELVPSTRGSATAARVLLEKAGDRNVLFKALLDLAGVSSAWAYLRPDESVLPRTNWAYPETGMFPFRYVAVDDEDAHTHFVSLSSRTLPFGLLPEYLYGGRALVLDDEATRIVRPAPLDIDAVGISLDVGMELSDGTGGKVEMKLVSRAAVAYTQKESFRTIQGFQKNIFLQRVANGYFPGARLEEGEFTGIDDDVTPFTIAAKLTAPNLVRPASGVFLLKALPRPLLLVRTFGGKRERHHPFHLRSTRVSDDRTEIRLSDSYRLERTPADVTLATALGDYSLTYESTGDGIVVRRHLTILPGRLSPEEYLAFVEFCERVDAAETENIILKSASKEE